MHGSGNIRFSELFKATVRTHGVSWAWDYYVGKHRMSTWEFMFWRAVTKPA
jgi:hypothetical protein